MDAQIGAVIYERGGFVLFLLFIAFALTGMIYALKVDSNKGNKIRTVGKYNMMKFMSPPIPNKYLIKSWELR